MTATVIEMPDVTDLAVIPACPSGAILSHGDYEAARELWRVAGERVKAIERRFYEAPDGGPGVIPQSDRLHKTLVAACKSGAAPWQHLADTQKRRMAAWDMAQREAAAREQRRLQEEAERVERERRAAEAERLAAAARLEAEAALEAASKTNGQAADAILAAGAEREAELQAAAAATLAAPIEAQPVAPVVHALPPKTAIQTVVAAVDLLAIPVDFLRPQVASESDAQYKALVSRLNKAARAGVRVPGVRYAEVPIYKT